MNSGLCFGRYLIISIRTYTIRKNKFYEAVRF
jgi:hypothetical protein